MKKLLPILISVATFFPFGTAQAACCGFELAAATNAGLQAMTQILQGTPQDGRSLSAIRNELENINKNLANDGKLATSLQSAQQKHAQSLLGAQLQSQAEIAKREAAFKANQSADLAYGSFNAEEACANYDNAIKQIEGNHNYQEVTGMVGNSFDRLYDSITHSTDRVEAALSLNALTVDQLFPQSGFYQSPEDVYEAAKTAAFIVNPYPQPNIDEDKWKETPFGLSWKAEKNILDARLAPVKAAMADIVAGYSPTYPLDERMKSVLSLSPYTEEQVTVNGQISKNFYIELLGSSRYYNPKYIENITIARGDALIREAIYAYSDLLLMENEALKVEQQNTALLAVIASNAINARTEDRLKDAANDVSKH